MLEYRKPKTEAIPYELVKQKFIMKIETGEIKIAVILSNAAELNAYVKSITKPETKEVSKVLEMLEVNQLCITLSHEDKKWEIFRLNSLSLKETYEELSSDFTIPMSRYEREKKKKQEREQRSARKVKDPKEHFFYKSNAQILELTTLSLSVPHALDPFLDSLSGMFQPFVSNNESGGNSPISPINTYHEETLEMLRRDLINLFNHKYIFSVKDFRLTFEDNPLEVNLCEKRQACCGLESSFGITSLRPMSTTST